MLGLLYVGRWPLLVLVAGMGLIGFWEYARIWAARGIRVSVPIGCAATLALILWAGLAPGASGALGAILAAAALVTLSLILFQYEERSIEEALITLGGVLYVGFLLSHLLLLRGIGDGTGWDLGLRWVLLAFLCTWAADIFAFFVGVTFGKHRLAPKISPKKSVEGLVGGAAAALVVGALWGPVAGIGAVVGGIMGVLIAGVAVLGDLAESALKRYGGVKDSGTLLPGHGGVLDRFDSSLFVLPFVYYIATLVYGLG